MKYYLRIVTYVDVEVEAENREVARGKGIMEAMHTELDNDNWTVWTITEEPPASEDQQKESEGE